MSARRCNGCGLSVGNPHRHGCPRATSPRNVQPAPITHVSQLHVHQLPPAPARADLLEAERTLMAFYRPAGGDA